MSKTFSNCGEHAKTRPREVGTKYASSVGVLDTFSLSDFFTLSRFSYM